MQERHATISDNMTEDISIPQMKTTVDVLKMSLLSA